MRVVTIRRCLCFLAACLLLAAAPAEPQAVASLDKGPEPPHLLKDQPIEPYQLELLDLAWRAATAYPLNPHIKNRARAEEHVVHGALDLKQPHLAWGYAKKVVNWRKGACYAEIAHYLVEQGDLEHVEYFLQQAILHSKDPKQGWRHARVKARVAAARVLMGDEAGAEGLVESQDYEGLGEELSARGAAASDEEFASVLATLAKMASLEGYNEILATMNAYAELYASHFDNPERREKLVELNRAISKNMPGARRLEVALKFASAALDNGDPATAEALIDEADEIRRSYRWQLDLYLDYQAQIAAYRAAAGQQDAARELLEAAVELGEEKLKDVQNFYRADAMRPVAEAYAKIGDEQRALELYKRVVAMGAENPNLRPRISDITDSCVSMAVQGIEPDDELFATIRAIVNELAEK
ncbi:MAG: tetratricopeptide repeat protein [Phycisphaeraceae bacterium]